MFKSKTLTITSIISLVLSFAVTSFAEEAAVESPNPVVEKWAKAEKNRAKSVGGSGGFNVGMNYVDFAPVNDLLLTSFNSGFEFGDLPRFRPVFSYSGGGYIGITNGMRIGGFFQGGKSRITSETKEGNALTANTEVEFGVFMVEKAFVRDRFNIIAGGGFGGGDMEVITWLEHKDDDDWSEDKDTYVKAKYMVLEVHGSCSYTVVPGFFHLGLEATVPAFLSNDGFRGYVNEFYTINPGLKFKVIFGNLG
jgi:hypothetical protein